VKKTTISNRRFHPVFSLALSKIEVYPFLPPLIAVRKAFSSSVRLKVESAEKVLFETFGLSPVRTSLHFHIDAFDKETALWETQIKRMQTFGFPLAPFLHTFETPVLPLPNAWDEPGFDVTRIPPHVRRARLDTNFIAQDRKESAVKSERIAANTVKALADAATQREAIAFTRPGPTAKRQAEARRKATVGSAASAERPENFPGILTGEEEASTNLA
jgi:hypothetical protein